MLHNFKTLEQLTEEYIAGLEGDIEDRVAVLEAALRATDPGDSTRRMIVEKELLIWNGKTTAKMLAGLQNKFLDIATSLSKIDPGKVEDGSWSEIMWESLASTYRDAGFGDIAEAATILSPLTTEARSGKKAFNEFVENLRAAHTVDPSNPDVTDIIIQEMVRETRF